MTNEKLEIETQSIQKFFAFLFNILKLLTNQIKRQYQTVPCSKKKTTQFQIQILKMTTTTYIHDTRYGEKENSNFHSISTARSLLHLRKQRIKAKIINRGKYTNKYQQYVKLNY